MPPMDMPPMDMPQDMSGDNMGGNFMPQGDGMGQMPMDGQSEFDTNFDAGVEADEEQDPKKFIQQLTGKLSQSLRKYNDNNGQPDVDLNKYVAGMIVKQATEGLSQDDVDEIIQKVKADEDFSMEGDIGNDQGQQQMPMGNDQMKGGGQEQQMMPQQPQVNEWNSKKYRTRLSEIMTNDLYGSNEKPKEVKKTKGGGYRKKPFNLEIQQ